MMPDRPNLFQYAVSELAQDAFICWLLAWADHGNDAFDTCLHKAGLRALNALLRLHDESVVADTRVKIRKQVKGADIVVEVGETLILLIEDKANAAEHGDQLTRYLVAIAGEYPGRKVLPVFLKTGDQSNYKTASEAGYQLFLREDFLVVLQAGKKEGVLNAVFLDFLDHLEGRDRASRAYAHSSPEEWDHYAWAGFYMEIQKSIPELHWEYVPNQTGGFMGAWWYVRKWQGWEVYLQIEQQNLCLKLREAGPKGDTRTRAEMRDRWLTKLQQASLGGHPEIKRPRWLGIGWSMTAGRLEGDEWLVTGQDRNVNMRGVIMLLREVEAIVDRALDIAD